MGLKLAHLNINAPQESVVHSSIVKLTVLIGLNHRDRHRRVISIVLLECLDVRLSIDVLHERHPLATDKHRNQVDHTLDMITAIRKVIVANSSSLLPQREDLLVDLLNPLVDLLLGHGSDHSL